MVLVHNVWVADWRIVITLLAWLTLIKGIVRLNLPHAVPRTMMYFRTKSRRLLQLRCILPAIGDIFIDFQLYKFYS